MNTISSYLAFLLIGTLIGYLLVAVNNLRKDLRTRIEFNRGNQWDIRLRITALESRLKHLTRYGAEKPTGATDKQTYRVSYSWLKRHTELTPRYEEEGPHRQDRPVSGGRVKDGETGEVHEPFSRRPDYDL